MYKNLYKILYKINQLTQKSNTMALFLVLYALLTYSAGIAFMIMTAKNDKVLTVGDLIMLVLAPFTMFPIFAVQLVSTIIDIDTVIYRK